MSDEHFKIELGLIDLEVNKRQEDKEDNKYSFETMLNKVPRQEADLKTSMINCPFCTHQFLPEKLVLDDYKDDELLALCPECGSVLKRYRKK